MVPIRVLVMFDKNIGRKSENRRRVPSEVVTENRLVSKPRVFNALPVLDGGETDVLFKNL